MHKHRLPNAQLNFMHQVHNKHVKHFEAKRR
jgi:hypothetical protein